MFRNLILACCVATSLAACASANKRYEQGQDLLRAGRPAEAAERYIQALKKDSRLDSARAGLKVSGAAAIEGYLRAAADPATQPDAAAENFLAIDDLSRRALEVGIFLVPPDDYDARRRAAFDRAINDDIGDAPLLATQRQFANALSRLSRASSAFQPSAAQQASIGTAGAQVALAWGRADTTDHLYRSAWSRVTPLVNQQGLSRAITEDARALQAAALARGTKRVAVLPAWATVSARRELPDEVLPALADGLQENPWANPPAFITLVPQYQLDPDLRRRGFGQRPLTPDEAARVGRTVGADLIVITEVDSAARQESGVRTTRRPARTRSGVDTAYFIDEGTARLFARATFGILDRDGQRLSEYQSVTATTTTPFSRIRYAGDYRSLDLRLSERESFERAATDRDLARAFAAAMSPRLGDAVMAELLRRIP